VLGKGTAWLIACLSAFVTDILCIFILGDIFTVEAAQLCMYDVYTLTTHSAQVSVHMSNWFNMVWCGCDSSGYGSVGYFPWVAIYRFGLITKR